jgi:hypothetical protein
MIKQIVSLHEVMTPHVLRSGVGQKLWHKLIKSLDKFKEDRLRFLLDKLEEMHNGPWKEVNRIWTLPNATDDMWENMRIMSGDDHDMFTEQKILTKAQFKLKEFWLQFKIDYKTFVGNQVLEAEDESSEATG